MKTMITTALITIAKVTTAIIDIACTISILLVLGIADIKDTPEAYLQVLMMMVIPAAWAALRNFLSENAGWTVWPQMTFEVEDIEFDDEDEEEENWELIPGGKKVS